MFVIVLCYDEVEAVVLPVWWTSVKSCAELVCILTVGAFIGSKECPLGNLVRVQSDDWTGHALTRRRTMTALNQ